MGGCGQCCGNQKNSHTIDVNRKSSIAFLFPNKDFYNYSENDPKEILMQYVFPIQDLERITGVDFFYKLSEEEEIDFEDRITD